MTKGKWDKRTNSDLQNTTQKTKDRATRIPLNTGRVGNSCSTSSTRRVNLFTKPDLGWLFYIQRGNTQGICRKIWLMVAID